MVIDLVIVTAPKPPGSSVLISPAGAVFEIAPAKVLQGAVRLQGFASSPTPETQVRVAWALTVEAVRAAKITPNTTSSSFFATTVSPDECAWLRVAGARKLASEGTRDRYRWGPLEELDLCAL